MPAHTFSLHFVRNYPLRILYIQIYIALVFREWFDLVLDPTRLDIGSSPFLSNPCPNSHTIMVNEVACQHSPAASLGSHCMTPTEAPHEVV